MTDDKLKQLADASELSDCLYEHISGAARYEETWDAIVRFAALVRAEEREACARLCEVNVSPQAMAEGDWPDEVRQMGLLLAADIRARGEVAK